MQAHTRCNNVHTNNVNAVVIPRARGGSGRDGNTALLLLLHPIHGGSTFMHFTNLVRLSSVVQDAFRGGGLAGINVGHDTNVSVVL